MTPEHTALVARLTDRDAIAEAGLFHAVPAMRDAAAALRAQAQLIEDHEDVHVGKRRLARELDVILNGEEGAAKRASLCDIVGQAAAERRKSSAPLFLDLASLRSEVAALRKDAIAGRELWAYLLETGVAWDEDQDAFVEMGLLAAVDMRNASAEDHCEACVSVGDCDHCYRPTDLLRAALADKPQFTDGRGNSLDHLVEEKP